MAPAAERVTSYLADDESVRSLTSGTLLENATRRPVTLGLTDRRVLAVSETGAFTDVRYDCISSIRSSHHSRVRYRPRPDDRRTMGLVGALLALAAIAAVLVYTSSAGAFDGAVTVLLAVATVGTAVAVQRVRTRSGDGTARRQLFVGAGLLALTAFVGAGLLSASAIPSLFVLVTVAGAALLAYVHRHRGAFGRSGFRRDRENQLEITTIDGHTVRIAVDPDAEIDRKLSAHAHGTTTTPVGPPVARSSVR